MKINQIISETTVAGSIAPMEQSFVKMQTRNPGVYGDQKVGNLLKGKKTNKKFANSISESKQVDEAELQEDDLILVPGQGIKVKPGFHKIDPDKAEHEGLTLKNSLHTIIRVATHLERELSVRDNFPEWVSEKIGAIKSNMVTVMDYLISQKEMDREGETMEENMADFFVKTAKEKFPTATIRKDGETMQEPPKSEVPAKQPVDVEQLKQEFEKLKNEYKQLGGDSWKYADRMMPRDLKAQAIYNQLSSIARQIGNAKTNEGAKVDRMVKHIAKSEREAGKSKDEAENIAWATANKRGYLDNKNKKKH